MNLWSWTFPFSTRESSDQKQRDVARGRQGKEEAVGGEGKNWREMRRDETRRNETVNLLNDLRMGRKNLTLSRDVWANAGTRGKHIEEENGSQDVTADHVEKETRHGGKGRRGFKYAGSGSRI